MGLLDSLISPSSVTAATNSAVDSAVTTLQTDYPILNYINPIVATLVILQVIMFVMVLKIYKR